MIDKNRNNSLIFPHGFLWGTATAAHQVEGNNIHSDWWKWEKDRKLIEDSGIACDHYHKFKEDFRLAKEVLHNNAHRLSIEWAKIEPKEGKFDENVINHYKEVLAELKRLGLKSMVTLHHFTLPLWFSERGGWEKKENLIFFKRFVERCAQEYKNLVDYWITINEPNIYTPLAYLQRIFPPQKGSLILTVKVYLNLASTHKAAYKIIHSVIPNAQVGAAVHIGMFKAFGVFENLFPEISRRIFNYSFFDLTFKYHDFLGINYYALHRNTLKDIFIKRKRKKETKEMIEGELNDLGWTMYPSGIYTICKEMYKRFHLPIIITENGIPDAKDEKRPSFIINHLSWLHKAIEEGVDVRGYFHWSLMDNFEWNNGRKPRFGLFEINYKTLERIPRKSAYLYGEISKNNGILY